MAICLPLAHHQVAGTTLYHHCLVAVCAETALASGGYEGSGNCETQGKGINKMVLLRDQGEVSAESLARWDWERG